MMAGPRHPRSTGRTPLAAVLALTVALAGGPLRPADAQERERSCRCVDEEGREIERCRCELAPGAELPGMPRLRGMAPLPPPPPGAPEVLAWSMAGIRRARLGVTLGAPAAEGAVGAPVEDVLEDGPADRAGLRAGDVIVGLDGHDLAEPVDRETEGHLTLRGNPSVPRLLEVLSDLEPGEEVEIAFLRDGERRTVPITPERHPAWERMERVGERMRLEGRHTEELRERLRDAEALRFRAEAPRAFVWEGGDAPRLFRGGGAGAFAFGGGRCPGGDGSLGRTCVAGAELLELNPSLGAYFGTEEGVLVPEVEEDSPLGLRAGDVILAIDGRTVASPEDVRRILRSYEEDEEVTLRILRQREAMDVRGRLGR